MEENLTNIKKLAKMLDGHQMVTVDEFRDAVSDFINAFAQHRSAFGEISKKNEESMATALKNLQAEFETIRGEVKTETGMTKEEMKSMMAKCMSDMKEMCDEMESRLPKDGEDGLDADEERIIQEVLAKIKIPEPTTSDTPDEVVDKVNSSSKKIKKERVEGLEQAILNSASNAVNALPITTTLVNGKRAKNLNITGATVNIVGDTANVSITSGGTDVTLAGEDYLSLSGQEITANPIDLDNLSATGTPDNTTYLRGDNTWATIAGGGDVSKVGTPVNNQIGVWTGDGTIEGTTGLTYDGSNLLLTGDIGATGTRITKGWFTDLQVTNAIVGSITGNAATVTTNANLTGVVTSVGNATAIADGALSIAKTSGLQAALDLKAPLISPTFTTSITGSYLTASEMLITDGSKNIVSAPVATYPSLTELTYLKGVTSAIQTQLNAKGAGTVTSVTSANGDATVANTTTTPVITIVAAPKWTTGRTLAITGDLAYTSPSLDGTGNVTAAGTLATVNSNVGSFGSATAAAIFTVNAKGLITAASSATITPAVGSITGLGTGVATALAVNVGSAGAFVTFNGALGTPSSGTVTNLTGTASININGTVGATTPSTGVFTTLVAGSTTSLLLGTAGSAVGNIGFRNATSGTITLAPVTGALGTVTLSLPAATDTLVGRATTDTLTNKRNQPRTASSTTSSNLSPDLSTANVYFRTTQTATLTIDAPTGTPVIGEVITLYVDSAGAQTLTINSTYKAFGAAFPATTTAGKTFMMTAMYNGTDWKTTWANAI